MNREQLIARRQQIIERRRRISMAMEWLTWSVVARFAGIYMRDRRGPDQVNATADQIAREVERAIRIHDPWINEYVTAICNSILSALVNSIPHERIMGIASLHGASASITMGSGPLRALASPSERAELQRALDEFWPGEVNNMRDEIQGRFGVTL